MAPPITALVIEDYGESLALLHAVLEPAGIRVVAARSAEEARRLLETVHPDVVLCDLVLPGEDGLAFVRWLRTTASDGGRRIPAIAMTAFYERYSASAVREAGFDVYIQKPLDPDQIPYMIGGLIARSARDRDPG
jgi:CheY-like chemotaxis protein